VQIDVEIEPFFVLLLEFFCQFDEKVGLREGEFSRLVKGAVEIFAKKTGSIVAGNDAVRVEHGYDVKDIALPQFLRRHIIAAQILEHALGDEGRVGLPGVHSSSDQHHMLVVLLFLFVRDFDHRDGKSTQGAERRELFEVGELG